MLNHFTMLGLIYNATLNHWLVHGHLWSNWICEFTKLAYLRGQIEVSLGHFESFRRKIKNRLECSKRIIWWGSTYNDTPGDRYRISFLESWYFEPNRKSTKSRRRSETNLFYKPKTIILTFSIIWKNNSWDINGHRCWKCSTRTRTKSKLRTRTRLF